MERKSLEDSTVVELRKQAERLGIEKTSRLKKIELIDAIEALEEQSQINQETKPDDRGKDTSSEEKNIKTNQSMHRSANGSGNNGSNGNGSRSPYYKIKDSMDNVVVVEGILEILPEGFGFVKNADMSTNEDFVYISG